MGPHVGWCLPATLAPSAEGSRASEPEGAAVSPYAPPPPANAVSGTGWGHSQHTSTSGHPGFWLGAFSPGLQFPVVNAEFL